MRLRMDFSKISHFLNTVSLKCSQGRHKMNQANDYLASLDHQWGYQMPLKIEKFAWLFLIKSQFFIFFLQNRPILDKIQYIKQSDRFHRVENYVKKPKMQKKIKINEKKFSKKFQKNSKRSPIQVRLGSMLLQLTEISTK